LIIKNVFLKIFENANCVFFQEISVLWEKYFNFNIVTWT